MAIAPLSTPVMPAAAPRAPRRECPAPVDPALLTAPVPILPRPRTVMSLFFLGALAAVGVTATADHLASRSAKVLRDTVTRSAASLTDTAEHLIADVVDHKPAPLPIAAGTITPEVVVKAGNFYDSWQMLFTVAREQPHLTQAVAAYWAMAGGIGFVGANLLQGLQEAWVRFEESCIRAQLVSRLKDSFRQSIEIKQQQDDTNRANTADQLSAILARHGVTNPRELLTPASGSTAEELASRRNFFYMPTNRPVEPSFGAVYDTHPAAGAEDDRHGLQPRDGQLSQGHYWLMENARPLIRTGALVAGSLTGYLAKYTVDHMRQAFSPALPSAVPSTLGESATAAHPGTRLELNKYINLNNEKASFVELFHERHFKPLLGMLALGALLGVGRQVVTGLREIEVTRLNAETEYNYERFRWLQLDTQYHDLAEKTQLDHLLKRFDQSVDGLRDHPDRLASAARNTLASVSNLSPPPYYLVTPAVALEAARS